MRRLWLTILSTVLAGTAVFYFASAQITPAQLWSQFGTHIRPTNTSQDLQIGTAQQFTVDKSGNATTSNEVVSGTLLVTATSTLATTTITNLSVAQAPKFQSIVNCNILNTGAGGLAGCNNTAYITLGSLSPTSPIGYNSGTGVISCATCVTNVSGSGNIASSGGTTPNITFTGVLPAASGGTATGTLGNLTLGSNLSFTAGDGKLSIIGTSTQISLGSNVVTTVATGTTGNIFNASIASNILTLNLPISSGSATGSLASGDWTTFNNKVSTNRQVLTGTGLQGGGDLSADRTISLITPVSVANGGTGTTTIGSLSLSSSNLSFSVGDGINVLIGTSTTISLTANPTFTKITSTNSSTTNASVSGDLYTGIASGNCVQTTTNGKLVSAGGACATGLSGGTVGYVARWTSASTLSTAALLDDGTVAGANATSSGVAFTVKGISGNNNALNVSSSTGLSLFQILPTGVSSTTNLNITALGACSNGLITTGAGVVGCNGSAFLTGNQTITLSGDVTGSGATAITTTLATVNSNTGSFGDATHIPTFTVNGKGLITAASNNAVIIPTVSGAAPQVGYFTAANTINGSNNFEWYNTAQILSVNSTTPYATLVAQASTTQSLPIFVAASTTGGSLFKVTGAGNVVIATTSASQMLLTDANNNVQSQALGGDATLNYTNGNLTLATVNSNVGTFGSSGQHVQFTVNGKGLITAASNVIPSIATSTGGNTFYVATSTTNLFTLNLPTNLLNNVATGTAGNNFNISTSTLGTGMQMTINMPNASASNNGQLLSTDWTTFNNKQNALTNPDTGTGVSGQATFWTGATSLSGAAAFLWDNTAKSLLINTSTPAGASLYVTASTSSQTLPVFGVSSTTGSSFFKVTAVGNVVIATTTASQVVTTDAGNNIQSVAALPATEGGTGETGITGILQGNGASAVTADTGTTGYVTRWSTNNTISTGIILDNATVGGVNATSSTVSFNIQGTSTLDPFNVASATAVSEFNVKPNYRIGIGSTTPTATLAVEGFAAYPTADILAIASSTGTRILTIAADGGFEYGTTTLDASSTAVFAGQYRAPYWDNGTFTTGSALPTIDWNNSNRQRIGLASSSAVTLKFVNIQPGAIYTLVVQQASSTAQSVTWPSVAHWSAGTAPTLTTGTYGVFDIITFFCGGGPTSNCYGAANTNFTP